MTQKKVGGKLRPDNNPGGARFCPEHERMECTKNRRSNRGTCHGPAVRGTDACKMHSGFKLEVARAQGRARITAWSPFGDTDEAVSSPVAVLSVLQMSWLRLAAYSELLRRQAVVEGEATVSEGETVVSGASGLIGFRYGAAGKDGTIYAVTEEARALVMLEAAERDRVVKYAKTAHDMGISDRLTALAENWADVVATKISLMLDALELTPAQKAMVPHLIQSHLAQIEIGAGPSSGQPE